MGEHPLVAVLAQAQQLASRTQWGARQVEERVHLARPPRELLEPRAAQAGLHLANVIEPELDLHFVGHGGEYKAVPQEQDCARSPSARALARGRLSTS